MPVIASYCMPSKKPESRMDHRPQLADLEYNSLITYTDNIQLLYREEAYNPNSERRIWKKLLLRKTCWVSCLQQKWQLLVMCL